MSSLVKSSENYGVSELILFQSSDGEVSLPVEIGKKSVWLTQSQMARLFDKDRSVVSRHIANAIREGEIDRKSNVQNLHIANSDKPVAFYDLDVIISVGYRVKSQRGVEFRRWATEVLRRYIVEGVAENERRLAQLGQTIQILERLEGDVEAAQILDIVKRYSPALSLLDDYDHQSLQKPEGSICT